MQSPYTAVRFPTFTVNAGAIAIALTLVGCGSSGSTVTSPSTLSKCAVAVDVPASTLPAGGATGAIAIKTERECQWTAQPEVNWLSITAGASGQGDGAVQFNAAANNDPVTRSGGVMVNGQRAQVTQAGAECRFELAARRHRSARSAEPEAPKFAPRALCARGPPVQTRSGSRSPRTRPEKGRLLWRSRSLQRPVRREPGR